MRVLGVVDSDSYVKWGASMLDSMPVDWTRDLVVIRTPALPSPRQLAAAVDGTSFAGADIPLVDLADLAEIVLRDAPDVVVLSVRGPVVRVLVRTIAAILPVRPVIVSGLPGIAIPETYHALYFRSQVDLIVLHSKREIRAFRELAESRGMTQDFALATLPFLAHPTLHPADAAPARTDIVFAAQAKVPRVLHERLQIVDWLVDTARAHPDSRVVVKLRGLVGEPQTHEERHPYDVLLAAVDDLPSNLVVSTDSMSAHLARAGALVTVSSTAAIESIASGVPLLLLDDFGVSGGLINLVFEHSGLLGGSGLLVAGEFGHADAAWLDQNYFHPVADNTWISAVEAAVRRRDSGAFPLRPQFQGTLGGRLRRIWDRKVALGSYDTSISGAIVLAVGRPVRAALRKVQAVRAGRARRAESAPRDIAREEIAREETAREELART